MRKSVKWSVYRFFAWIPLLAMAIIMVSPVNVRGQCEFIRGNLINTGPNIVVDAHDAVFLLAFLFTGTSTQIPCIHAADINDNGFVEISDFLDLLRDVHVGSPNLPPPNIDTGLGVDPTPGTTVSPTRDSRFSYSIGNTIGFPSQTGLEVAITMTSTIGTKGFQMALEYDGTALRIGDEHIRIALEGGVLHDLSQQSYIITHAEHNDGPSFITISALIDWDIPLSSATFDTGTDQVVAILDVQIWSTAQPQTTQIIFKDGIVFNSPLDNTNGTDPIRPGVENFIVIPDVDGLPVDDVLRPLLDTSGGFVDIKPAFIRGDSNNDRGIHIADTIYLLSYLFQGSGNPPPCMDAGDVNNDSKIDVADPIYLLNYQFFGFAPPPEPFPFPGLDPELDNDGVPCDL